MTVPYNCASILTRELFDRFSGPAIILVLSMLGVCVPARAQRIVTFDAPGAGTGSGQGTFALGMNPGEVIEGYYTDASNGSHGFIRVRDGAITSFDAPGAGTAAGQGTFPQSINPAGAVTGYYVDSTGLDHGFLRATNGTFTSFDAPGAGTGPGSGPCGTLIFICPTQGTEGASINPAGVIAGQYVDASGVYHSFVRDPNGTITTFDDSLAGTAPFQGTLVTFTDGINAESTIAGGYFDANNVFHASVRAPDGEITNFDVPGQVYGANNSGINAAGTTTSYYLDGNNVLHGWIRDKNGDFTFFDVLEAGSSAGQGTFPLNINTPGDIVGAYIDAGGVYHGFLRLKAGKIITFDPPHSQGTFPICNNAYDAVSGYSMDANGVAHGFLRTPPDE